MFFSKNTKIFLVICLVTCGDYVLGQQNVSLETVINQYVKSLVSFGTMVLPLAVLNFPNTDYKWQDINELNNDCGRELSRMFDGLKRGEKWAYLMMDATAKPQSGLLMGNIMHLGNFDECLNIRYKNASEEIHGKYCSASFSPHKKYGNIIKQFIASLLQNDQSFVNNVDTYLSYGVCIPSVCNSTILNPIIDIFEEKVQSPLHFQIFDKLCYSKEPNKTIPTDLLCGCIIFGTIGVIIILSTLYDVLIYQKGIVRNKKLLIVFSLYTNGKKAFSSKSSADSLHCLNGIRVISMMWIILGHRFMSKAGVPHTNILTILENFRTENKYMIILGATFAVDTFFTISAILVVYLFLSRKENKLSNIPMFYFHRILRLTPSLLMVIIFILTILKYTGSGPLWSYFENIVINDCKTNWWKTLLYIQNYVDPHHMCISTTWYLAVDTQLYFFSPLLLFPLLKWPKQTLAMTLLLAVGSMVIAGYISWVNKLGVLFFEQNVLIYYPTYTRAGPWLLGIICGYIIFKTKDCKIHISKFIVTVLWIFSLTILCSIIFINKYIWKEGIVIMDAAFYNATHKTAWSFGICIIIFLCVKGYGGFVNSFLSHKVFNILIRFNYNLYLVHMFVILYPITQKRESDSFTYHDTLQEFWGDFVFSLLMAIVWTLCFESPIISLEKIIFGKEKLKDKSHQSSQETIECDNKMTAGENINVA